MAEVKRQLSQEEHEQVEKGETMLSLDDGSSSAFVVEGLELKENQCIVLWPMLLILRGLIYKHRQALLIDLKGSAKTVGQQTSIQWRQTSLLKRITKYSAIRKKYMPGLDKYLAELSPPLEEVSLSTPELIPLYLPSSLPPNKCSLVCFAGVQEIEDRLRFAQASEALNKLQCQLMKCTYASRYKVRNVSSQRHYTQFWTLQEHTELKIKSACWQYTMARNTILALRGPGIWEKTLQELYPNDIQGLSEKVLANEEWQENRRTHVMAGLSPDLAVGQNDDFDALPGMSFNPKLAVGEGHRTLSWIWYTMTNKEVNDNRFTDACEQTNPQWNLITLTAWHRSLCRVAEMSCESSQVEGRNTASWRRNALSHPVLCLEGKVVGETSSSPDFDIVSSCRRYRCICYRKRYHGT
jgi:hypothetical protein